MVWSRPLPTGNNEPGCYPRRHRRERTYGKYRGMVLNNIDRCRSAASGRRSRMSRRDAIELGCRACPLRGGISAGCFIVPPIGSQVWMEFEQGGLGRPDLVGGVLGFFFSFFFGEWWPMSIFATAPHAISRRGQKHSEPDYGENMVLISDCAPTPATGGSF